MKPKRAKPPIGGEHEVGYGRPPHETRFRKGQSGNPRGRPPGRKSAHAVILEELYRLVTVREGEVTTRMPALQAMLRSLITQAIKGKATMQRAMLALLQMSEASAPAAGETVVPPMTDLEAARRIAFVLHQGVRELDPDHTGRFNSWEELRDKLTRSGT